MHNLHTMQISDDAYIQKSERRYKFFSRDFRLGENKMNDRACRVRVIHMFQYCFNTVSQVRHILILTYNWPVAGKRYIYMTNVTNISP